ncbi:MAG: hypothetical protein OHK0019_23390 [Saprospiraceae bacterium]
MKKALFPFLALVAILAFQCSPKFALPFGKDLRLTQLLGESVPAAANIGFKFDQESQKIMGKAGCNNFSAPFTLKGDKLSFGEGVATKMACPNMELENKFLGMLSQVKQIKKVGSKFQFFDEAGKALAAFSE